MDNLAPFGLKVNSEGVKEMKDGEEESDLHGEQNAAHKQLHERRVSPTPSSLLGRNLSSLFSFLPAREYTHNALDVSSRVKKKERDLRLTQKPVRLSSPSDSCSSGRQGV